MKHYLITGTTSGIGQAVASGIEAVADKSGVITPIFTSSMWRQSCDFSDLDAVTKIVAEWAIERGPFDGVFHAAGVAKVAPLRLTSATDWAEAMMAATSAFGILRAVSAKGIMKDGGSVVLMSSVAAQRGAPGMCAYSAGKGAIEALTRSAAVELAPRGIRVNAIAAGAVRTPMHDRITSRMTQPAQDGYVAAHPLGFGSVEAVRDAALYLLGDASKWTTGTVMVVDGGFLAK